MEMKTSLLAAVLFAATGCATGSEAADARPPIDAPAGGADARGADAALVADAAPLIDAPLGSPDANVTADAGTQLNIGLRIVEVYYDHTGADDRYEWVKLYNGTPSPLNLGNYSFGWGGVDYTVGVMDLAGTIPPYGCYLVGGPMGNATSGSPMFDLGLDFNPDLQNSGSAGDGVAIFNLPASGITATTTPVHAVIYGPNNNNNLYDENGAGGNVDVDDAPSESAIRMKPDQSWEINPTPTPNGCF